MRVGCYCMLYLSGTENSNGVQDAFQLADAPEVLKIAEGMHVLEASGAVTAMVAGGWRVACRHTFSVPEAPTNVDICFQCAPELLARQSRVMLLDDDSHTATELLLGIDGGWRTLAPNAKGYTIMALTHAVVALPQSTYRLRLLSDLELSGFQVSC